MAVPKTPGPLPDNLPELVEYAVVRSIFKWKRNTAIQAAIKRGSLVRVKVGRNVQSFRITRESVLSYHADCLNFYETCKDFGIDPAHMRAMAAAKKARVAAPVPQVTVELDEREVIRQAHNLDKTPAPSVPLPSAAPSPASLSDNERLGQYLNSTGRDRITSWCSLDWLTRNRLREKGLAPN